MRIGETPIRPCASTVSRLVPGPIVRCQSGLYPLSMSKFDHAQDHDGKLDMQRYNEVWKNIISTAAGILVLLSLLLASKVFGCESENPAVVETPPLTAVSGGSR